MRKDFSPEEKLLRLIRGSKKKESPRTEQGTPKIEIPEAGAKRSGAQTTGPKEANIGIAKAFALSFPPSFLRYFNTRTLNVILLIVFICLVLYFIFDLAFTAYIKNEPYLSLGDDAEVASVEKGKAIEIKPYSHYSSAIEGRNIFLPQEVDIEPVFKGPALEEVSASLSLIGIIAGERPQAIIEDKKTGKSYFLYNGGSVGQVKVVDILEDRVVMDYEGQKFELML